MLDLVHFFMLHSLAVAEILHYFNVHIFVKYNKIKFYLIISHHKTNDFQRLSLPLTYKVMQLEYM